MINLSNPVVFYVVGISAIAILLVLLNLSIYYYCKAKDLAPYLMKREELQKDIATSQRTMSELREEIRKINDELAKANRLISEGDAAKEWLEINAPKVESLQIEVESLKTRLKEATDAYQRRQQELDNITKESESKQAELSSILKEKNEIEVQLSHSQNEKEIIESEIERIKIDRKSLNEEISKLTSQKNQLDAEVKDLEERKKQRDTAVSEFAKAKAELSEIEGHANAARKVLSECGYRDKMNEDRWNDLDRPYCNEYLSRKMDLIDEENWLQQFLELLKTHDITFNERIIKAFHTGLKCADYSPLVILAGISGTGKSLLPELYSAALGMNYLPVAIQPRWDSPQDMFGFYNYMEGKYKATELSRLLWQFDIYNNPKAQSLYKTNKNTLPLNLILLDEMNLARVEYYFSDLLSKLEVRRGLNITDPDERRKAEMEIECNSSDNNEQIRRLFVGSNTLFIGTMNEDETTQTLSDKVIDRSNVLRFGRPKRLGGKPNKERFMEDCRELPAISDQNWNSWQEVNLSRSEHAKQLILSINEALEKVGRPFAHRVWQAIEAYISFYPGNDSSAFNAALSDQIEMKILPKLNGLELDVDGFETVKTTISKIIEDLGDDALIEAFHKSCDHNSSFFKWRGVMR